MSLDGTQVLLVDDDPDTLEILEFLVTDAGAVVRTAGSGKEALDVLSAWTPQVVLLDITMPEMDGVTLLSTIQRQPGLQNIPAVAVSALSYSSDKERAFAVGFSAYVTKPFDGPALIDLVEWLASPNNRRTKSSRPPPGALP